MFTNRLFRSPDGDGGFGPSLADLDNPIEPGDGTKSLPDLAAADQAAADAEAAKAVADKAAADAAAATSTDGADDNAGDQGDQGDDIGDEGGATPEEFYGTVSKLSGIEVPEIDWTAAGITDPLSPEGVAHRDKVILEKGATDFEAYLKTTAPKAYAYFQHQQAGLPDEQFFETAGSTYTLPPKADLADSVDLQTSVYKYDLMNKGNSEEEADALVALAIKNNKLGDRANASYGTIENAQAKQLADAQAAAAEEDRKFQTIVSSTKTAVSKQMNELSFIVPEAQKPEFEQYVMNNLRVIDGKVFIVQELSEQERKVQMEALLLQWKKGDLSTIVRKAATTQATQRLRLAAKASSSTTKKDEGIGGSGAQSLPLSAI